MTATPPLVPLPSRVERAPGDEFQISPATAVRVPDGSDELLRIGRWLAAFIGTAAGAQPPRVEPGSAGPGDITLRTGDVRERGDEAYDLSVTAAGTEIVGRTPAGVRHGVQTFRQLLPSFVEHRALRANASRPVRAAAVRVSDSPRFAWRGAMLDVARHFFSIDEVRRYVDLLQLYKFNRLHLHLSDDQGWRIEIESWPRLAAHGGSTQVGGGPGGYYSQRQYADLAAYAADRGIVVVPEIDMPGHTTAALASYPELAGGGEAPQLYTGTDVGFSVLGVDEDATYRFVEDVVREIGRITPGPYFHIGGDEVRTLTPEQYIRFIDRVQAIVESHGKQMIGWDEIAPASRVATAIVQHWRPKTSPAEAAGQGAQIIMSPADRVYLDMKPDPAVAIGLTWAGIVDAETAYDWDPATAAPGVSESAVLGVEAPLWTETAATMRDVELLAFPRLAVVAEVAWSRQDRRAWEDFRIRLGGQAPRWSVLGVNFFRTPKIPWAAADGR